MEKLTKYQVEHLNNFPESFLKKYPENSNYYNAFSKANISQFKFGCLKITENSHQITYAPYFIMKFKLGTMIENKVLQKLFDPLKINIACVGHPSVDICRIDGEISNEILFIINQELLKHSKFIAYKGFTNELPLQDFTKIKGLPVPVLKLNGNFWQSLNSDTRSNFKRKFKKSSHISHKLVDSLNEKEAGKVYGLYLQTYEKAKLKFEKLNLNYFLQSYHENKFLLFYDKEEIIGFVQLIIKPPAIVFRYVGLEYSKCTDNNLYFSLFFRTIEIAEKFGCSEIDWGATSYHFKMKLGSNLIDTYNYFYCKNKFVQKFLTKLKFLFEPSPVDLK